MKITFCFRFGICGLRALRWPLRRMKGSGEGFYGSYGTVAPFKVYIISIFCRVGVSYGPRLPLAGQLLLYKLIYMHNRIHFGQFAFAHIVHTAIGKPRNTNTNCCKFIRLEFLRIFFRVFRSATLPHSCFYVIHE